LTIVGPTGSGKSQLISDIEQWTDAETPSKRRVLINDIPAIEYTEQMSLRRLVAEVSQNMNFVIDMSVEDFLRLHAQSRQTEDVENMVKQVVDRANCLTGEPIRPETNLANLSGGQSRALMVADVALISNAPVVLIDEIENAGINRLEALKLLTVQEKVVVAVTHDPLLALMADRRVVMKNGGMTKLLTTAREEKLLLDRLLCMDCKFSALREQLRQGGEINQFIMEEVVQ
jgi:ABC-type lipoprotein export system ATPase subunit